MAIKKPRPKIAPIIKPSKSRDVRQPRLMDNQDTRGKGDSLSRDRVQVTFWVTPERREEMREWAAEHEMTVSRLIVEGVEMRMKK